MQLQTEVLVVGGGAGATTAAIQAARRGAQTIVVSDGPWLGGMLTSAGVSVPDGNELAAWQSGIWGAFLRELGQRGPGLDHSWVSFFSYRPEVGAALFADWVAALPNLRWFAGGQARSVTIQDNRLSAVTFSGGELDEATIEAQVILDGTELGDLLALAAVPYRWGWESKETWQEPSAPTAIELATDPFYQHYPVQSPTWVVQLEDVGSEGQAEAIEPPAHYDPSCFEGAWANYGAETFLNYGRLPGDRFMINWPICGNDYGEGLDRLLGDAIDRAKWEQEAQDFSRGFAYYIQQKMGRRYGLAPAFPIGKSDGSKDSKLSRFALQAYYRESRRLIGLATVTELDILPVSGGQTAALPRNSQQPDRPSSIAIGNYPNDHHYPGRDYKLAPKSQRWGGRWTGTPFTIPYGALVSDRLDGLLVCEKNISVSHMANGATRLQPVVLGIGQAAGMAAALCVEQGCAPRDLAVRDLQDALLTDPLAPAAVIPLYNLPPGHPDWLAVQRFYLDQPDRYPMSGIHPDLADWQPKPLGADRRSGLLQILGDQHYQLDCSEGLVPLVTEWPLIDRGLANSKSGQKITVQGYWNPYGPWFRIEAID
jgi:FAD dependent oxidoreductase